MWGEPRRLLAQKEGLFVARLRAQDQQRRFRGFAAEYKRNIMSNPESQDPRNRIIFIKELRRDVMEARCFEELAIGNICGVQTAQDRVRVAHVAALCPPT